MYTTLWHTVLYKAKYIVCTQGKIVLRPFVLGNYWIYTHNSHTEWYSSTKSLVQRSLKSTAVWIWKEDAEFNQKIWKLEASMYLYNVHTRRHQHTCRDKQVKITNISILKTHNHYNNEGRHLNIYTFNVKKTFIWSREISLDGVPTHWCKTMPSL